MKMLPAILVLMTIMLAACSELQQFGAELRPSSTPVEGCGVNRVMRDLYDTRGMNKEQLQATLRLWEQEYQANPSDSNRLRLALLCAASDQSVRDADRARKLLAEVADSANESVERDVAVLLRQLLDEQTDAYRKINTLNKQAADQSKRITELEQQQRALMSIEQKIQQRETPAVIDDEK